MYDIFTFLSNMPTNFILGIIGITILVVLSLFFRSRPLTEEEFNKEFKKTLDLVISDVMLYNPTSFLKEVRRFRKSFKHYFNGFHDLESDLTSVEQELEVLRAQFFFNKPCESLDYEYCHLRYLAVYIKNSLVKNGLHPSLTEEEEEVLGNIPDSADFFSLKTDFQRSVDFWRFLVTLYNDEIPEGKKPWSLGIDHHNLSISIKDPRGVVVNPYEWLQVSFFLIFHKKYPRIVKYLNRAKNNGNDKGIVSNDLCVNLLQVPLDKLPIDYEEGKRLFKLKFWH